MKQIQDMLKPDPRVVLTAEQELDAILTDKQLTTIHCESSADVGGLSLAIRAFQKLIDSGEVDENERIDGFLPWERFFVTWAKTWREVGQDSRHSSMRTAPLYLFFFVFFFVFLFVFFFFSNCYCTPSPSPSASPLQQINQSSKNPYTKNLHGPSDFRANSAPRNCAKFHEVFGVAAEHAMFCAPESQFSMW
jgi:predicted metalloendopeptidase